MRRCEPGYFVQTYDACWWVHLGLYVLRIGNPWNKPRYQYAWRPLLSFFKCFKSY